MTAKTRLSLATSLKGREGRVGRVGIGLEAEVFGLLGNWGAVVADSSADLCRFWGASWGGGRASKFCLAQVSFAWSLSGKVFGSSLPNFSRIRKADLLVLYARVEALMCAREEEDVLGPKPLVVEADLVVDAPTAAVGRIGGGAAPPPCLIAGVVEVLEEGATPPLEIVAREVEADIAVLTLGCGLATTVLDEEGGVWIVGCCRNNPFGSLLGLAFKMFVLALRLDLFMLNGSPLIAATSTRNV